MTTSGVVYVSHPDQLTRVGRGADHVESAVLQDVHDPFPDKGLVLADNDTDLLGRRHALKLCLRLGPAPIGPSCTGAGESLNRE